MEVGREKRTTPFGGLISDWSAALSMGKSNRTRHRSLTHSHSSCWRGRENQGKWSGGDVGLVWFPQENEKSCLRPTLDLLDLLLVLRCAIGASVLRGCCCCFVVLVCVVSVSHFCLVAVACARTLATALNQL